MYKALFYIDFDFIDIALFLISLLFQVVSLDGQDARCSSNQTLQSISYGET